MRRLIDFDRPVAVLMVTILHFVTAGESPAGIRDAFRDAFPDGGRPALTHATNQDRPDAAAMRLCRSRATSPVTARSHAGILALFEGFDLVKPGPVHVLLGAAPAPRSRSRTTRRSAGSARESAATVREAAGHAPADRRAHP
ncbi:SAM-dependent methyltransferase [Streptomyces sp. NPDC046931]|uniref:SAM-dependent methyltransferase n=1 Tax=Streptomyces sp. NPDC046931 TaxID=3154806 RepID=UPI0033EB7F0E